MPMRNAAGYITPALRSILAPQECSIEVIVVDDGSTDGCRHEVERLKDARVRVVDGPIEGIAMAYNTALAEARGRYVARCDADDLYVPGRLAAEVAWLEAHPEFVAVCTGFGTIDDRGRDVADLACGHTEAEITDELRAGHTRTHICTYLARTDVVRQLGGCRRFFVTAEDIDLQLRLGTAGRVGFLPMIGYRYRLHGTSITHQQADSQRSFFEETARLFARQRTERGRDDLELGCPPPVPSADGSKGASLLAQIQGQLTGRAWREHRQGYRFRALTTGLRACLIRPGNLKAWKSLIALMAKGTPSAVRGGKA